MVPAILMKGRRKPPATKAALLQRIHKSAAYRGKHVVLMHGRVYTAESGAELAALIEDLKKKHPHETPTLAYVPAADSLILLLS